MAQLLDGELGKLFNNLENVLDSAEDIALIKQMVLMRLKVSPPKPAEPKSFNKLARDIFRISRQRNEMLGENCCPDPEWNMLLDLTIAHTESRPVDVTGLCIASGVPPTTALRHIERMRSTGLIQRKACDRDKRRNWIEITPTALNATETLLREAYVAGVQ